MPPTPARWCARKIGAAWAARTEKDVPSSPCSTPVYAAGETTTATARIGGTTVPDTSCHARASSCRSRCSRTATTRSSSDPIAAPSAPVRPNRGMHPGTHRRHRSVPGHRRPRCPRLGSNLGRQRHRPGCSIHRLQRFRSPWRAHRLFRKSLGAHRPERDPRGERTARRAAGGPGSPIG